MADLTALFRPEAVQARSGRALGEIALVLPPRSLTISLAAGTLLLVLLATVALCAIPHTVTLTGVLVQGSDAPLVEPTAAGVVTAVYVRDGQSVVRGQLLMDINTDTHTASGATQERVLQALLAQRADLVASLAEIDAQQAQRNAGDAARDRLGAAAAAAAQLSSEAGLQRAQSRLMQDQLVRLQPAVAAHVIAANAYDDVRARSLDAQSRERDLAHQTLVAQADALAATAASADARHALLLQHQQILSQQAHLDERIATVRATIGQQIRAPIAGVVAHLDLQPGSAVTAGQPVMAVLPRDAPLRAKLLAPYAALAQLPARAMVRIVVVDPATGIDRVVFGRVHNADAAALTTGTGQGGFSVWVDLPPSEIALRPGVAVRAVVALPRRNLFAALVSGS